MHYARENLSVILPIHRLKPNDKNDKKIKHYNYTILHILNHIGIARLLVLIF